MEQQDETLKREVRAHWEAETCGTRYSDESDRARYFRELSEARYRLEPYIFDVAGFADGRGKRVLEIGVGAGADFSNWCRHAEHATGVDLTDRAIELTRERLAIEGVPESRFTLKRMDAERLELPSDSFDIVYSYGVLHHSPDTRRAFTEVMRVLRPGGEFRGMIYHLHSWTTYMLWAQQLLRGRFDKSPREVVFENLESPGTKVYTVAEARDLLRGVGFEDLRVWTQLCPGDLLTIEPSKKYQSPIYKLVWKVYPRPVVRLLGDRFGLALNFRVRKPA